MKLNPKTKRNHVITASGLAVFASLSLAHGGEIGHYAPAVPNIRDLIVPEPGFYTAVYMVHYNTDTYRDPNGNSVKFHGTAVPNPGQQVVVDFLGNCQP